MKLKKKKKIFLKCIFIKKKEKKIINRENVDSYMLKFY